MRTIGRLARFAAAVALLGSGCTGQVGTPMHEGAGGTGNVGVMNGGAGKTGGGGTGGSQVIPPGKGDPGHATFRRLNRFEYNNTVRDLLGDTTGPANTFPPDAEAAKAGYLIGGAVAHADASHLLEAAEALGATAATKLDKLLPCNPVPAAAVDQDTCARNFITSFGKRAFRRPLSTEEAKALTDFYAAQRMATPGDFPGAIRLVITAFLMSPQFLYRWEASPKQVLREGALVRFNSWEMASRLSYLVWGSMPDDTAFGLAEKNQLGTPDQIDAEVRRLLKDPRAKAAIADFFTQWLGVADVKSAAKDTKVYPAFSNELAASMVAETAAFAANAVIEGDGKLTTIFTSSDSLVDANLAKLYGLAVTSPTVVATKHKVNERAGILTHISYLTQHASADESNPVRRGKLVADRILCTEPPPPPDVVPQVKEPDPNMSVRERYEEHDKDPCASACHLLFDPIGFAFENYNGIGVYQTMDGGKPVNATGEIELDGKMKPFKNGIELQAHFGKSKQVSDCMGRQFLRYALRRRETPGDEASMAAALTQFAGSGDLRELIVGLTKSRVFTHRTPSLGEVLQ
jgi:Protein of unknown function (DUF1592)/Protein of unknown function (DUF1588)/Protein of unknown function (DUF1595)/Protein of unknown function (DUF1587)/Protein of unknown function (DUF1585)